jgi:hypothetical protein
MTKSKIIPINIGLVFVVTVILNIIAYNAKEAKGIGYLYFSIIGLVINMGLLVMLGLFNMLVGQKIAGKNYFLSVLFSIATFLSVTILFWLINVSI